MKKAFLWCLPWLGMSAGCNTLLDIEGAPKLRSLDQSGGSTGMFGTANGGGLTSEAGAGTSPAGGATGNGGRDALPAGGAAGTGEGGQAGEETGGAGSGSG